MLPLRLGTAALAVALSALLRQSLRAGLDAKYRFGADRLYGRLWGSTSTAILPAPSRRNSVFEGWRSESRTGRRASRGWPLGRHRQ